MRVGLSADDGASAAEYALLISGVAALIVTSIVIFGGSVGGLFDDTCETVASTTSTACN